MFKTTPFMKIVFLWTTLFLITLPATQLCAKSLSSEKTDKRGFFVMDAHIHMSPAYFEDYHAALSLLKLNHVKYAAITQISGVFDNSPQEKLIKEHPGKFANIIGVDWKKPDAIQTLKALVKRGVVSGLRLTPDARSPGDDPLLIWRTCADLNITVSVFARSHTDFVDPGFENILATIPNLRVMLEHLSGEYQSAAGINSPNPSVESPPYSDFKKMLSYAKYPNVYLGFGGFGEFSGRAIPAVSNANPFKDPAPFLDLAYTAFGPHRLVWGSDYPPVSVREGYRKSLELPLAHFADKPLEERALMFGKNALKLFPIIHIK